MNFLFLPFLFIFLIKTGCSIYSSEGRKLFEERAHNPQASRNLSSVEFQKTEARECWTQPAGEPLWRLKDVERYSVTVLHKDSETLLDSAKKSSDKYRSRIEVCIERNQSLAGD